MPENDLETAVWQAEAAVVRQQRRTVRVLIAGQVIGSFGMGASPSVGILLAEEVMGSELLAGVARTSATLGAAIFGIPLALLAVRSGRRIALSLGWSIAALGALVLIFAATVQAPALLIGGMLLFGAGTAVGLQSRFAATDLARPARRGRTLSLVVWSGTFGSVLGPNLGVPGEVVARWFGLPPLAGAFVISVLMVAIAAILIMILLRPDPLLTASSRRVSDPTLDAQAHRRRGSFRAVIPALWRIPSARFALLALVGAHVSMVSLMTMTPVHMHHHGAGLSLVGITISVHVVGMFAFAPVVGWASDRWGPVRVIVAGQLIFIAGAIVSLIWAQASDQVMVSLFLLGLGWSCGTVPGSILLSDSVPAEIRPSAQGVVDTTMNTAAAGVALLSGPMFALVGFGGLSVVAIVVAVPILILATRQRS